MNLKAKPSQCFAFKCDFPTAAASLIERNKPAGWTLFSSNTGNWPDWTDFSIMTAPTYDANTGQCAVRELV